MVSIKATPEHTKSEQSLEVIESLPRQFHVSSFSDGTLNLGPGQVAMVPLSFLPRFPAGLEDLEELSSSKLDGDDIGSAETAGSEDKENSTTAPPLSTFQEADRLDLLGTSDSDSERAASSKSKSLRNRNNLENVSPSLPGPDDDEDRWPRYLVTATIVVETDRGDTIEVPLEASSVRHNSFGLPDIIYFDLKEREIEPGVPDNIFEEFKIKMRQQMENSKLSSTTLVVPKGTTFQLNENGSITIIGTGSGEMATISTGDIGGAAPGGTKFVVGEDGNIELADKSAGSNVFEIGSGGNDTGTGDSGTLAWIVDRQERPLDSFSNAAGKDCFDIFIRNPTMLADLIVTEVRVSDPLHTRLMVNRGGDMLPPQQVIDKWERPESPFDTELEGPFTIPAGDWSAHYLATVCAADHAQYLTASPSTDPSPHSSEQYKSAPSFDFAHWFDFDRGDDALGAVQIKSTYDTMVVSLRKADDNIAESLRRTSDIISESAIDPIWNATFSNGDISSATSPNQTIRTSPDSIFLRILSWGTSTANATFDVANMLPHPIKVMRASVALETIGGDRTFFDGFLEEMSLKSAGIDLTLDVQNESVWKTIGKRRKVSSAFGLNCSLDWEKFNQLHDRVVIRGAVVLRASADVDLSIQQWKKAVKSGDSISTDIVVEIPLKIEIVGGTVGLLVQGTTHPAQPLWSMKYYNEDLDVAASAFFPLHNKITDFQLTPEEKARLDPEHTKGVEHQFRVFNDLSIEMVVDTVEIVAGNLDATPDPSLCDRFDAYVAERGVREYVDLDFLVNMGLVFVRYRFPVQGKTEEEKRRPVLSSTCYLRMTTDPPSGTHEIPFLVYSGRLEITGERLLSPDRSLSVTDEEDGDNWHETIVGFENVVKWFQNSKGGYALHSILKASAERGNHYPMRDGVMLGRYLFNLAGRSMDLDIASLNPILIKVGAIADGDTETLPLYMTNYNPTPITTTVDVGEVEGMSIAVGRDEATGKGDGVSILDILPVRPVGLGKKGRGVKGRFRGHPLNALRQFLRKNEIAKDFFDRLPFRDDISMDRSAVSRFPVLRKLYREDAVARYHKSLLPMYLRNRTSSDCDSSVQPSLYGSFSKKLSLSSRKLLGPVIISCDRKSSRRLSVCSRAAATVRSADLKREGTSIVIPPGGVARFDVRVRSPATRVLEKDITQFVATGLVLSTDLGEVLPIIVSFDALQGKLELSNLPSIEHHCNDCTQYVQHGTVRVPARLFGSPPFEKASSPIKIPPHGVRSFADLANQAIVPRNVSFADSGVSLFMKSSFLRNIYLRKIVSCNPLFRVTLVDETFEADADPFLGVYIGSISSSVSCDSINGASPNASQFPSFFRCVFSWLANRAELQPRGCGTTASRDVRRRLTKDGDVDEATGIDNLIKLLKRTTLISEWSDKLFSDSSVDNLYDISSLTSAIKSGRRNNDGLVSPMIIDAVAGAWNALQSAANAGLLSLGTDLRAIVEYNATAEEISPVKQNEDREYEESTHLLSVAFHNISVESTLEIPTLLSMTDSQKTSVTVADGRFDPLQVIEFEPTLVADVNARHIRVSNPTAVPLRVRLAAAPSIFGSTDEIRKSYLGTLPSPYVQSRTKLSTTPTEYAHRQWWDSGGAFFHPDFEGDMVRSHYNITIKSGIGGRISLVNPSFLGSVAFLVGCGSRCGLHNENKAKKNFESLVNLTPTSPIGASAAVGKSLVGRPWPAPSQENGLRGGEMTLSAGGSLISDGAGPAAFAIPYSALDEVIIPPFGEADLGPIFFRPPGRASLFGCASLRNTIKNDFCTSQLFESVMFLENSFSGLERIVLRGKALWEKVVFLDPVPGSFGDIELRNGQSTLVFPGIAERFDKSAALPVLKEVLVHNDGDIAVTVSRGYFSHVTELHERSNGDLFSSPCELNHFHLLGCGGASGIFPFSLLPGTNRSIFVEHYPQCTKRKDYIALNIELEGQKNEAADDGSLKKLFGSSSQFQSNGRTKMRAKMLRKRKVELVIGYEMSNSMFSACLPVRKPSSGIEPELLILSDFISQRNNSSSGSVSIDRQLYEARKSSPLLPGTKPQVSILLMALAVFSLLGLVTLVLQRLLPFRIDAKILQRSLRSTKASNHFDANQPSTDKNWTATFRCLARVDPTSTDLQSLGREQTRQIVFARLRARGALAPQCFTSTGVANRERPNAASSTARQAAPGTASAGSSSSNERIRKSEALFGKLRPKQTVGKGCLPAEFGWRSALSRGILDSDSLAAWSSLELKTDELLSRRKCLNGDGQKISDGGDANVGIANGSESFHDDSSSGFDSSIGETSDGEAPQGDVHVSEVSVPKSISAPGMTALEADEEVQTTETKPSSLGRDERSHSDASRVTDEFPNKVDKQVSVTHKPKGTIKKSFAQDGAEKERNDTSSTVISPTTLKSSLKAKETTSLQKKAGTVVDKNAPDAQESGLSSEPKTNTRNVKSNKQKSKDITTSTTASRKSKGKKQQTRNAKSRSGKAQSGKASGEEPGATGRVTLSSKEAENPNATIPLEHPTSPATSPKLRPPPGLLPPPGFGDSSLLPQAVSTAPAVGGPSPLEVNTVEDSTAIPSPPATSDSRESSDFLSVPAPVMSRNVSDQSNTVGEAFLRAIHSETPAPASPARDMTPLEEFNNSQGRDSDFDVMDFLDGILDEGNGSATLDGENAGGFSLDTTQTAETTPMFPPDESPGLISANPWASNNEGFEASRAAAYGIAFEQTGDSANIPLLTPATIFAANAEEQGEDEKSDSFYAGLLNE